MQFKTGKNLLDKECRIGSHLWSIGSVRRPGALLGLALLSFLIFSWDSPALARSWFVDTNNAQCSDTGPGTRKVPFCTIGAASLEAVAGDKVIVASGNYPERVVVGNSGEFGAPIVFKPATGASVSIGEGQPNGFYIDSKKWITIQGFKIFCTSSYGIGVESSRHITISGNHVTKAGNPVVGGTSKGIYLSNSSWSQVHGNLVDYNTDSGIHLTNGSTGIHVTKNIVAHNSAHYARIAPGIDVRMSSGNIIKGNRCHHNEDSGIQSFTGAKNNLIVNNVCYRNGDHGIHSYNAPNQRIVGNTVYKNVTAGISIEGQSYGAKLANNISVDNGINSPRTSGNIRVDKTSVTGTTLDFDLVYLSQPSTMIFWGSAFYENLDDFVKATGREKHGIEGDPLWVNPTRGDFHLMEGSPAIDSANSGASGTLAYDLQLKARVDDPTSTDTGSGPCTYYDRGAFEYQPK